jgi:Uncharacterized protein conserved in bacteria (DUF2334)
MEDLEDIQMKLVGYSIFALMVAYTLINVGNGLVVPVKSYNNLEILSGVFYSCRDLKPVSSEKKVVLRIDDIQANYLRDVSISMIEDAAEREMKTYLAVIPYSLDGDREVSTYLKKNSCWFEVAMHGWDNGIAKGSTDIPEFAGLSYEEAVKRIRLGKVSLKKNLNVVPVSFVPPNNEYSEETGRALRDEGFVIVSAEGEKSFDYDASTYDFLNDELVPTERVLNECMAAIDAKKYCIIMMHPQDFVTDGVLDPKKYAQYTGLLDGLQANGVEVVTMSELAEEIAE